MARRFFWGVVILTVLLAAVALSWQLLADRFIRYAFTPDKGFAESVLAPAPDYHRAKNWLARPDIAGNPALWAPDGYRPAPHPEAALFFVSPTAWVSASRWNAPLDDAATNERLQLFARLQASAFNGVAEIWMPRYRQATLEAVQKPSADGERALATAGEDVARAFAEFLAAQPADRPLIIAGHDQGSYHLLRLVAANREALKGRLVAVYAPGWPVMAPTDMDRLGIPACTNADESGCLLSWLSFAADADTAPARQRLGQLPDLSGTKVGSRAPLCINPLSGSRAPADPERNLGMLKQEELTAGTVGARCANDGLLLIAPTPTRRGRKLLPEGDYHIYDYALFWANIRADAEARLSAFGAGH